MSPLNVAKVPNYRFRGSSTHQTCGRPSARLAYGWSAKGVVRGRRGCQSPSRQPGYKARSRNGGEKQAAQKHIHYCGRGHVFRLRCGCQAAGARAQCSSSKSFLEFVWVVWASFFPHLQAPLTQITPIKVSILHSQLGGYCRLFPFFLPFSFPRRAFPAFLQSFHLFLT